MKKVLVVTLALLMVAGVAMAAERDIPGVYVKGGLALTMPEDATEKDGPYRYEYDMDAGLGVKLAVGYDFGAHWRAEAELHGQENDVDSIGGVSLGAYGLDGDATYSAFMINGYYDHNFSPATGFYGTAGLGLGEVDLDISYGPYSIGSDDDGLVWKLGFGVFHELDRDWTIDLGYEYMDFNDMDFGGRADDLASHNIVAAVRYKF